ncbi:OmpA family protein [Prosthecobacter sp.]|uniref:OmpA family protein n=1 Tax=Prosthecobacter sp. TaxID=1965333 RepID=UPI0037835504
MKTFVLILGAVWCLTGSSPAQQAPATTDGSAMKADDIAKQWQKTVPAGPVLRTRGLTRGGGNGAVQPTLRTRGAGLSQKALEANTGVLEILRNRGMKILKGSEAAAAQAAQDQAAAGAAAPETPRAEAPPPPPPVYVEVPVVQEKQIAFRLRFKKDSTELADAESRMLVATIAQAMKKMPDAHFLLEGHTCDLGESGYNLRLSEMRALQVRTLLGDMGIPAERLLAVGQGESQCEVPNTSESSRALNRRVVIGPIELPHLP